MNESTMNPSQVLASFRQNGNSSAPDRPYFRHEAGARGSPVTGANRIPLGRVHQQPHVKPGPDNSAAFYDLVKKNNFPTPTFATLDAADKKSKVPQWVSKVKIGDREWKTHPLTYRTADEAMKGAMAIAYQDLCTGVGNLSVFPEAEPVPNEVFLQRILEVVKNEPTGMIDSAVVEEYIKRYKCNVPKNWFAILSACGDKITLTQNDVHNKTIYTISPPKVQCVKPKDVSNCSNQAKTAPVPSTSRSFDTNETLPVPTGPVSNANDVKPKKEPENIDCESNGDMLATLAIIPPAVLPPISVKPEVDGTYFDLFCTIAASPHHFWVQPYNSILPTGALFYLTAAMNAFYDNEENRLPIVGSTVKKGVAFAAKQAGGYWCRVIVDSIVPDSDPLEVVCFSVDHGEMRVMKFEDLQPLYSQFQRLPRQAIKSCLSNVAAPNGDWSVEAAIKFKEMVEGKPFVSLVKGVEGSGTQAILQLQLIDTSTSEDLDVGKMLVDQNMAIFK